VNLGGTASDGHGTVGLVTWTNYQASVLNGTATGTSNWVVMNNPLNSSLTNFLLVTGRGTSWSASMGGNTTFNDTLAVTFPLVILHQPISQIADQGTTVQFGVELASNRSLARYQWQFNGLNLTGATNSVLILTNVQPINAGAYSLQASNIFGAVLSSIAILTVNRPPIANPQSVSGDEDTAIAVTLSGSDPDGDSLSYHMTAPSHGVLEGVVPAWCIIHSRITTDPTASRSA